MYVVKGVSCVFWFLYNNRNKVIIIVMNVLIVIFLGDCKMFMEGIFVFIYLFSEDFIFFVKRKWGGFYIRLLK